MKKLRKVLSSTLNGLKSPEIDILPAFSDSEYDIVFNGMIIDNNHRNIFMSKNLESYREEKSYEDFKKVATDWNKALDKIQEKTNKEFSKVFSSFIKQIKETEQKFIKELENLPKE